MNNLKSKIIQQLREEMINVINLPQAQGKERLAVQLVLSQSAPSLEQIKILLSNAKPSFFSAEDTPGNTLFLMKQDVLKHDEKMRNNQP